MRRIIIFLITCCTAIYAKTAHRNINNFGNDYFFEKRAFYMDRLSVNSTGFENFDVIYYRCKWQVDPSVRYIDGKVTSYFKIISNSIFITYDLSDSLSVDSIMERNHSLTFSH